MPSRFYLRVIQFTLLTHTILAAACGSDSPLDPTSPLPTSPRVSAIRVLPLEAEVTVHEVLRLTATALDAAGQELPGVRVTFGKMDHTIFHLDSDGIAIGAQPGTAVAWAEAGILREYFTIRVLETPAVSLTLSTDTLRLEVGDASTLLATLRDANDIVLGGRPVSWTATDPAVAGVTASGLVTARAAGITEIIARHGELADTVTVLASEPPIVVPPPVDFGGLLLFVSYDQATRRPRVFRADANDIDRTAGDVFVTSGANHAVVSPDGQRIAFTCAATHGPAICVSNIDGYQVVELTGSDTYHEDQPTWSPDGQSIAFRRWPHGATPGPFNPTDIWVMRANGSQQVNLTADDASQQMPAWAPAAVDGASRIAYVQETVVDGYVRSQLFTMRADGSERRALTANAAREDLMPSWSPDARALVFVRRGDVHFGDLFVVDVATGAERELIGSALADEQLHPAWSPNGAYIAFTSMHEPGPSGNYRRQVYTVRADGTSLTRRSTTDVHKEGLAWWSTR